ncbi:MAG: glycosyltransferase family 39 protein [Microgenomates group bacterium]
MTYWDKKLNQTKNNLAKTFPIIFLISLSAFLIFYKFNQIPKNLSFDEVEFSKLALSLDGKPYIPYSRQATGHSTLYFYLLLFSFKIFGINNFALRFPSALFGVLNILIFYSILEKIFNNSQNFLISKFLNFSSLLSLVLLSSHWYLNFTRFAFETTFLLFLELVSIYFLILFWQRKHSQNLFLSISGFFAGAAFNSYTPGRLFFFLPLVSVLFYPSQPLKKFFLFLIPLFITILPLSTYLITHKDIRIEQQFFWKNSQLSLNNKINYTWQNIKSTALMFHFKGDVNGRHNYPGKPALNPILGVLFTAGLILTILNWKNPFNLFAIGYFLFSIFPTILTYPWENPNMLRTYTALPSVVFFIANAIISIDKTINRIIKNRFYKQLMLYAFFLLLIFSCFYELRTYFKYQSDVFKSSFEIKYPLEKAIKMKNFYEK